jgi:HD-like signal output (HDOD) protein
MSQPASETAQETRLARITAEIGKRGAFPGVARVIERLRTVVTKEDCAALDVARIILQDAGLASNLLRLVNSAFYRRQGGPVSTVTRAVLMVGFEAIRDLASGLVLIEELLRGGKASAYVREGLCRALYQGLFSKRLAAQVAYPTPEEAYLLGLFADWGLLWLAAYYPRDFEEASQLAAARDLPIETAVREVFGGDPAELSAAILEVWRFPESFAAHFRGRPARAPASLAQPAARLSAIVQLAADYTHAAGEHGPESIDAVLKRGEELFGLTAEQLAAVARDALQALREHTQLLGLGRVALPGALAAAERRALRSSGSTDTASASATGGTPPSPAAAPSTHERALETVADITRSIVERRDINDILLMVLEGIVHAGAFDAAFLALVTVQGGRVVGRMGCGRGIEEFLSQLSVPLARGAALLADVVLERQARVVAEGSPALFVAAGAPVPEIPARAFIVTPLVVRERCVGVIVAARGTGPLTPTDQTLVDLFCNQAAVAFHHAAG